MVVPIVPGDDNAQQAENGNEGLARQVSANGNINLVVANQEVGNAQA